MRTRRVRDNPRLILLVPTALKYSEEEMPKALNQELAISKTKTLCGDKGVSLIGQYEKSTKKCLFFQEGYGEFYARPGTLWFTKSEHPKKAMEKRIATTLEKHGVLNNFLVKDNTGKAKRIATNLKKFGYENNSQNPEIIKRIQIAQKKTMMRKYGVEYAAQDQGMFDKICDTQHKYDTYTSSRFGEIRYQGTYELMFVTQCDNDKSIISVRRGPKIKYISPLDGNTHHYFIDFLLEKVDGTKEIIEVKSEYYYGDTSNKHQSKRLAINQAKKKYSEEYAIKNNMRCVWKIMKRP